MIAATDLILIAIKYKKHVAGQPFVPRDLTGKVYIITGCNTGIGFFPDTNTKLYMLTCPIFLAINLTKGFETAKQLVKMNATVIMACRSVEKANKAKESIIDEVKCTTTKVLLSKMHTITSRLRRSLHLLAVDCLETRSLRL